MLIFYVFAMLAGVATAIEPGQNAEIAESIEHPLFAGVISLGVSIFGILALVAIMLGTGLVHLPEMARIAEVPWWAWLGGLLSAALTLAQLVVSKKIGAASFLGIIVTTGVITSIGLDHFGLVGFKQHSADATRLVGGALMIAGVGLVARF